MTALIVAALLCAAPKPVLTPDPGTAKRLQPRQVTASSFLKNGWNAFDQNYLPPYAADDNAATAWTEGVSGTGEGEALLWQGPTLEKAKQFVVFIRNGYQKSEKLYRANARPKRIRLEAVTHGETGVTTVGKPVELELADVLGWQKAVVPVAGKVNGVRLTILSTYAGKTYDDTCISDLQVYVDGDDPYRPEAEAKAREAIVSFIAERTRAAKLGRTQAFASFAPSFVAEGMPLALLTLPKGTTFAQALEKAPKSLAPQLKRVLAASAALDGFQVKDGKPSAGWVRAKVAQFQKREGTAKVAFAALGTDALPRSSGLFSLKDAAFFEAGASLQAIREQIAKTRAEQAKASDECEASCESDYKDKDPNDLEGCKASCGDMGYGPDGSTALESGEFVQGGSAHPTYFLRAAVEDQGEREVIRSERHDLVAFNGDFADVILSEDGGDYRDTQRVAAMLEWDVGKDGRATLKAITQYAWTVPGEAADEGDTPTLTVTRYVPAKSS